MRGLFKNSHYSRRTQEGYKLITANEHCPENLLVSKEIFKYVDVKTFSVFVTNLM